MTRFGTRVFGQHLRLKLLTLILLVGGCSGVMTGSPPMPTYSDPVVKDLVQKYSRPDAVPTDPKLTVDQRNQIIEDLKYLIDVNYAQFEKEFFVDRAVFDTAGDLATLGLGGTGSLIRPSSVQAILAAVSAGLAGARVSINKNFFHEKSSDALIAKMRALRAHKLKLIRGAQILSLSDYSMSRALGDITDYYYAGTIVGALQGIISEAGEKERTSTAAMEKKLEDKIELQYRTGPLQQRINAWLLKDPAVNEPALEDWLKKRKPPVNIIPGLWIRSSQTSEAELLEAIRYFNIQ